MWARHSAAKGRDGVRARTEREREHGLPTRENSTDGAQGTECPVKEVAIGHARERVLVLQEMLERSGEKSSGTKRSFEAKKNDTVGEIAATQQDTSGIMKSKSVKQHRIQL